MTRNFTYWLFFEESSKIPSSAIKVPLPKVEQTTSFSCGASAFRSICLYYGIGPDNENEYCKLLETSPDIGTLPENMIKTGKKLGFRVKMYENMGLQKLMGILDNRIPVICALQAWGRKQRYGENYNGHYVVAIGYDESKIYFEDPSLSEVRGFLDHKEFLNRWHDEDGNGKTYKQLGIILWTTKKPNILPSILESQEVK